LDHQDERLAFVAERRRGIDLRPQLGECALGELRLILGTERVRAAADLAPLRSAKRELDREACAALGRIVDGDRAPMELDELLGDREAETRPSDLTGRSPVELAEALEDRLPIFGPNARPAVRDAEDRSIALALEGAADASLGGCELECIREHVDQDALELV